MDGPTPPWCDATERAMTTTGAGGLSGPGPWVGLGMQGAGVAEGSTPSATQSGTQAGASAQVGLPSATTLVQSARTALVQAQAQQAGVMLTLSAGAQSLLGGSSLLDVVGQAAPHRGGVRPHPPTAHRPHSQIQRKIQHRMLRRARCRGLHRVWHPGWPRAVLPLARGSVRWLLMSCRR
ncbi:hypothetical protein [Acetobacter okinawensis]|uniref:hypothetical protein n=1 Tax=Acetobacter okinawensis TaxID=1076594 RepID=UPI0011DE218E|nr:hypothetical protein [Acetobacter okinawensis]